MKLIYFVAAIFIAQADSAAAKMISVTDSPIVALECQAGNIRIAQGVSTFDEVITGGDLLELLEVALDETSCPLMIRADAPIETSGSVGFESNETLQAGLRGLQLPGTHVEVTEQNGIPDIRIRNRLDGDLAANNATTVPALLIRAAKPSHLVTIWAKLVDQELRCDEYLLQNADSLFAKQLARQTDYMTVFPELAEDFEPPQHVSFLAAAPTSEAEFYEKLALQVGGVARTSGGKWEIVRFQADSRGKRLVSKLLAELESDTYGFGRQDAARALKLLGPDAQPMVLQRARESSGYMLTTLVAVLNDFPTRERDQYFLEILENTVAQIESDKEPDFLQGAYTLEVLTGLVDNDSTAAIPLVKRLYKLEPMPKLLVMLNQLGVKLDSPPTRTLSLATTTETSASKAYVAILPSLLAQAFVSREQGAITVDEIKAGAGDRMDFRGGFASSNHKWTASLAQTATNEIFFIVTYYCGNLCGAGYVGRLVERNRNWIIIEWQQLYIS